MDASGTPARKRGRPRGQFDYKKGLLYDLIQSKQPCSLTNKELAALLYVSERQVCNYLRSMRETGLLAMNNNNHRLDGDTWVNARAITLQPKE